MTSSGGEKKGIGVIRGLCTAEAGIAADDKQEERRVRGDRMGVIVLH
jgi:hypothetical protein